MYVLLSTESEIKSVGIDMQGMDIFNVLKVKFKFFQ